MEKQVPLPQYQMVRVKKLLRPVEEYNGWWINKRSPEIGDIGTIVEVIQAPRMPDNYIVEASQQDGATIWLGDFTEEEIEAV